MLQPARYASPICTYSPRFPSCRPIFRPVAQTVLFSSGMLSWLPCASRAPRQHISKTTFGSAICKVNHCAAYPINPRVYRLAFFACANGASVTAITAAMINLFTLWFPLAILIRKPYSLFKDVGKALQVVAAAWYRRHFCAFHRFQ